MKQRTQFENISRILYWLVENQHQQPGLKQLSGQFGISEFHLQKVFQAYVGVSPKQFLKYLGKEEAKTRLRQGQTVLETAMDLGLSGPGRLHDLLVTTESVTPGQIRHQGANLEMQYGFGDSPFGEALIAWTDKGISFLGFCRLGGRIESLKELESQWPTTMLGESQAKAAQLLERVFTGCGETPTRVWLRGSPFQLKVWEALLRIPPSTHCTYGQIAQHIGNPRASRAVGTAIGRNPIAWLIPCHRVITSMGTLGGYRWGQGTKQAMIGLESAWRSGQSQAQSA